MAIISYNCFSVSSKLIPNCNRLNQYTPGWIFQKKLTCLNVRCNHMQPHCLEILYWSEQYYMGYLQPPLSPRVTITWLTNTPFGLSALDYNFFTPNVFEILIKSKLNGSVKSSSQFTKFQQTGISIHWCTVEPRLVGFMVVIYIYILPKQKTRIVSPLSYDAKNQIFELSF